LHTNICNKMLTTYVCFLEKKNVGKWIKEVADQERGKPSWGKTFPFYRVTGSDKALKLVVPGGIFAVKACEGTGNFCPKIFVRKHSRTFFYLGNLRKPFVLNNSFLVFFKIRTMIFLYVTYLRTKFMMLIKVEQNSV
jgi:hypothetical protein